MYTYLIDVWGSPPADFKYCRLGLVGIDMIETPRPSAFLLKFLRYFGSYPFLYFQKSSSGHGPRNWAGETGAENLCFVSFGRKNLCVGAFFFGGGGSV